MKCLFCQQSTISKIGDSIEGQPLWLEDVCRLCHTIYDYDCEHDMLSYHFQVGNLTAWFYPDGSNERFALTKQCVDGINRDILTLDFIPNLTPTNFEQKIKLYMVLS